MQGMYQIFTPGLSFSSSILLVLYGMHQSRLQKDACYPDPIRIFQRPQINLLIMLNGIGHDETIHSIALYWRLISKILRDYPTL